MFTIDESCRERLIFICYLRHQRKKCDLTVPWRLLGIPANALLEMFKLDKPRAVTNISVQLQIANNSRQIGSFMPTENLKEMIDWFRNQAERF